MRLLGALGNDSIRELLERAALGVLPCVVAPDGDRDSMPVALKEAMALELPVIGTREVGLPELIDADRGRLVPPADPPALALALAELLAAPRGRARGDGPRRARVRRGPLRSAQAGGAPARADRGARASAWRRRS